MQRFDAGVMLFMYVMNIFWYRREIPAESVVQPVPGPVEDAAAGTAGARPVRARRMRQAG